jgi:soluble lytic murein transglycosylase-like protein
MGNEIASQGDAAQAADQIGAICEMIKSAASANDLPREFFARIIWQESPFRSDAVGKVTRTGEQARGIAQFMPLTAAERRLLDPLDPAQALPKAAEYLRDLISEFGNIGLAAAAYNAGPQRVQVGSSGSAHCRLKPGRMCRL